MPSANAICAEIFSVDREYAACLHRETGGFANFSKSRFRLLVEPDRSYRHCGTPVLRTALQAATLGQCPRQGLWSS
jgi:hypothetical protein